MDIYDSCRQALKKEYDKDVTQDELGKRAGISQAHINRLLNGDSSFAKLKLETLLKLLPGIRVTLDGSPLHVGQRVSGNGNIVAGRDAHAPAPAPAAAPCAAEVEAFRAALVMELIEMDIDITAKDQVLRLVRRFSRE